MKFTITKHIKRGIALSFILWMGATSFAGNTIWDVPASANELRPIEWQTTPYNGSCDIEQDLAFYDKSPVYLRVGQPKSTINYVFDKTATYVIVYNQPLFQGTLKFPYVANFVPSSSFEPDSSNILTVEATGAIFSWGAMTMERDEIAGQIITKNNERAALQNAAGANLSYYYRLANSNFTLKNWTVKINIHPNITPKTSCTNYYIARCGDGVIDNADTDGIEVDGDTIERHSWSLEPEEECDDGELNGTPGHCKVDCTGVGTTPGTAGCIITANTWTIEAGQAVTISASYTSGASATLTPTLSGISAFTYPNRAGSANDTPTTTTTYTLNVQGITGINNNSCSTTVTVVQPQPHLTCNLTLNPSMTATGQAVSVGWNVSNGNFAGTYIYVTPPAGGARPHRVNANQNNGVTSFMATQTGQYIFTMNVINNEESAICTGILNIVDVIPSCSLTTTTPTINIGQTAVINGVYSHASLATLTPFITGLNFIYPNRSNTNILVNPTETTTYTMNVLGMLGDTNTCNVTIHVNNPGLYVKKELVTDVLYHQGDIVVFKVNFGNNSSGTIYNITVEDNLPTSLDYVNSQIYGVTPPYTFGTGMVGPYVNVEYSWFSLAPGQQWYMLIMGRYNGNVNDRINNAFISAPGSNIDHSSARFNAYTPNANATVTKTSDKPSYFPGEYAHFTIAVTNNGPDVINNIIITDDRPNSCITLDGNPTSNVYLSGLSVVDPYQWIHTGTLGVQQTIYVYITWHISDAPSCVGTYTNNAQIIYMVNGVTKTWAAQLNFTVSTTPSSTMTFEKKLIQYGSNPWDPVVFELTYKNNGNATITSYNVVDYRPGTLNFVNASPMPTTQTPMLGWSMLNRIFTTPLAPGASWTITINWTIQ
jgi:uncharacterized repeat protein (TIGR01451 family)